MKNKPEFQLAMAIFVGISILGTVFALWWASHSGAGVKPRTNVEPAREIAPVAPDSNSNRTQVTIPNNK